MSVKIIWFRGGQNIDTRLYNLCMIEKERQK